MQRRQQLRLSGLMKKNDLGPPTHLSDSHGGLGGLKNEALSLVQILENIPTRVAIEVASELLGNLAGASFGLRVKQRHRGGHRPMVADGVL